MNSTGFFLSFEVEYEAEPDNLDLEICLSGHEGEGDSVAQTLTAFMSVGTLDHLYVQISRLLDEINALPRAEPTDLERESEPSGFDWDANDNVTSLRRRIYRDIEDRRAIEDREVS